MNLKTTYGVITLVVGGLVLSFGLFGGEIVKCRVFGGCTTYYEAPENIADVSFFFIFGGIGLMALGVFILARKAETPKARFDNKGYGIR